MLTQIKRIAPPKRLLYGPGPSMVEPRVYEAMAQPVVGIRDPYLLEISEEIRSGLREVFGTRNEATFTVPAAGSGAMEAAITNFVIPGSKIAIFAAGHFADRMTAMARRQRANVVRLERPWGEIFEPDEAKRFVERERPQAVAFVQAETSTGAYQSGRAIASAARCCDALVIADTVTSLGAMPVDLDSVGIDIAFSCSQKGLSCPAGLSPISISPRAWARLEKRPEELVTWYFDLRLLRKYFDAPHVYHHTPAVPLYYALHQGLQAIQEEGLNRRCDRHLRAHERLVAGLERLGFSLLVKEPKNRIWHLTTASPPSGVDEAKLRGRLLERFGIEIGGGLGRLSGKIWRIGTMGPLAEDDRIDFLLDSIRQSI